MHSLHIHIVVGHLFQKWHHSKQFSDLASHLVISHFGGGFGGRSSLQNGAPCTLNHSLQLFDWGGYSRSDVENQTL